MSIRTFCGCCGEELSEFHDKEWPICAVCQSHGPRRHPELGWYRAVMMVSVMDENGIPHCPLEARQP